MALKSLQFQMRLRRRGRVDLAGNTVNLGTIQDVWHGYFCVSKQIMFSEVGGVMVVRVQIRTQLGLSFMIRIRSLLPVIGNVVLDECCKNLILRM